MKDKSLDWVPEPGFEVNRRLHLQGPGQLGPHQPRGRRRDHPTRRKSFFAEEPMKNRFKLIGSEKKEELNPRTKVMENQDLRQNRGFQAKQGRRPTT